MVPALPQPRLTASRLQPLGLAVTLARPDTLNLRQPGQQHTPPAEVILTCLLPDAFLFYTDKCTCKRANNVKALQEILFNSHEHK